jgi:hypothetical protein
MPYPLRGDLGRAAAPTPGVRDELIELQSRCQGARSTHTQTRKMQGLLKDDDPQMILGLHGWKTIA